MSTKSIRPEKLSNVETISAELTLMGYQVVEIRKLQFEILYVCMCPFGNYVVVNQNYKSRIYEYEIDEGKLSDKYEHCEDPDTVWFMKKCVVVTDESSNRQIHVPIEGTECRKYSPSYMPSVNLIKLREDLVGTVNSMDVRHHSSLSVIKQSYIDDEQKLHNLITMMNKKTLELKDTIDTVTKLKSEMEVERKKISVLYETKGKAPDDEFSKQVIKKSMGLHKNHKILDKHLIAYDASLRAILDEFLTILATENIEDDGNEEDIN